MKPNIQRCILNFSVYPLLLLFGLVNLKLGSQNRSILYFVAFLIQLRVRTIAADV